MVAYILANYGEGIPNTIFDANTIIKADVDNTPVALSVPENRIIGRPAGDAIKSLTPAEVKSMLDLGTDATSIHGCPIDIPDAGDNQKLLKYNHSLGKFTYGLEFPTTIANVLSDHTLSEHENIGLRKISFDTAANKPESGTITELFVETDTNKIYRGTGTGWAVVSRVFSEDIGVAADNIFKIPSDISQGDLFYVDANTNVVRLPAGIDGQFLKTRGPTMPPVWVSGSSGSFLDLNDTPLTYSGEAGSLIKVSDEESALEFIKQGSGNGLDADKVDGKDAPTGDIVGTTDAQELSSKTLDMPLIKDVDPTPVGDVVLKAIDEELKIRNSADDADKMLALTSIPTMDDAHIPDVETLSYGAPFDLAQIPSGIQDKLTAACPYLYSHPSDRQCTTGSWAWADITGKPSTYPPSSHNHPWGDITGKPSTYPPSSHDHDASDITSGNLYSDRMKYYVIAAINQSTAGQKILPAQLEDLPASKTTSGTFDLGRIPTLDDAHIPTAFLKDGSRGMTGSLNMNYNSISYVTSLGLWADDIAHIKNHYGDDHGSLELWGGGSGWPNPSIHIMGMDCAWQDAIRLYTSNSDRSSQIAVIRIQRNANYPYIIYDGQGYPCTHGALEWGKADKKWSCIYSVATSFGDLGFSEKECAKCGLAFAPGDNIVLKVIRIDDESGDTMTIPIHLECATTTKKTLKKKYAVKEDYYLWDEKEGRVVKRKRTKTRTTTKTKKTLKPGYEIDEETGNYKDAATGAIALESEATETKTVEDKEVVYIEKEFSI